MYSRNLALLFITKIRKKHLNHTRRRSSHIIRPGLMTCGSFQPFPQVTIFPIGPSWAFDCKVPGDVEDERHQAQVVEVGSAEEEDSIVPRLHHQWDIGGHRQYKEDPDVV